MSPKEWRCPELLHMDRVIYAAYRHRPRFDRDHKILPFPERASAVSVVVTWYSVTGRTPNYSRKAIRLEVIGLSCRDLLKMMGCRNLIKNEWNFFLDPPFGI